MSITSNQGSRQKSTLTSKPVNQHLRHQRVREAPWSSIVCRECSIECKIECSQPAAWTTTWRPVLTPSPEDRPIPARHCPDFRTWTALSSVYQPAFWKCSGISRHATNPLASSGMHTVHHLHPCPHQTNDRLLACTNCDQLARHPRTAPELL